MRRVGEELGNTPRVARSSYVDPRVIDRYQDGTTLEVENLDESQPHRGDLDEAVVELIEGTAAEPTTTSRR
jgi:DNA topoisomerase-1